MKFIYIATLLLGILTNTFGDRICYKLLKADLKENLKHSQDLIIDVSELYSKGNAHQFIWVDFDAEEEIPYTSTQGLQCMKDEEIKNRRVCTSECDGGNIYILIKEDGLYFKIPHLRMSDSPDDPVYYEISSLSKGFVKGIKLACPNTKEKNSRKNLLSRYTCNAAKVKESKGPEKSTMPVLILDIYENTIVVASTEGKEENYVRLGQSNSYRLEISPNTFSKDTLIFFPDTGMLFKNVKGVEFEYSCKKI